MYLTHSPLISVLFLISMTLYISLHLQLDPHPFLFGSPAGMLLYHLLLHNKLPSDLLQSHASTPVITSTCSCPYRAQAGPPQAFLITCSYCSLACIFRPGFSQQLLSLPIFWGLGRVGTPEQWPQASIFTIKTFRYWSNMYLTNSLHQMAWVNTQLYF